VVYWSVRFLWIIPASYWAVGIFFIISASFNALNRPLTSSLLVLARLFLLVVPLAIGGSLLFDLWGFLIGITVAGVRAVEVAQEARGVEEHYGSSSWLSAYSRAWSASIRSLSAERGSPLSTEPAWRNRRSQAAWLSS